MGKGQSKRPYGILGILILSVILFTGALSTPSFTSQSNEIIDDSIEEFTFGFVQLSSAAHITETYATTSSSNTSSEPPDILLLEITTSGTIPQQPDAYINSVLGFGYAWLDSTTFPSSATSATIHPQLDDGYMIPNNWHTHNMVIDANGCISQLNELAAGVMVNGQTISVITTEGFSAVDTSNLQSAISFEIVNDSTTCPAPLSGLKVVL